MKVFKFGGASINSIERIKNVGTILQPYAGEKILVVISAMGKTTNALEVVVNHFFEGNKDEALQLFEKIKASHLNTLKYLSALHWQKAEAQLKDFFTEVEWLLHDKPVRSYDYYYDQVVCCGELLSSTLVYWYFMEEKMSATWIDVRDVVRTDNNFRDAAVDWSFTEKRIHDSVQPLFNDFDLVITQGFIGATDENESTTLGREGSDFSAAIFGNLLDAEHVTIWKDVDAVMNADPKKFKDTVVMPELGYTEVVEMAYYGAQVIHPKTIKPLQNKNIPLLVKSFLDPGLPGTTISKGLSKKLPPVIVMKESQVLMHFKSKDFSFVEDKPVMALQQVFRKLRMKPNLTQNTAISLMCCFDDHPEKISQLALDAAEFFDVNVEKDLTLLTIRHYDDKTIADLTKDHLVVLEQKTLETVQMVMR
jgi:aspartate kinase